MSELERKIRDYYGLRPAHYHILGTLTLSNQADPGGACEQVLSLVMRKEPDDSAESLHLEFQGVRKLKLQQPDWSLISVGFIDISLRSETVEGAGGLLVGDTGHDQVVRFECRDFDFYLR